MSLNLLLFSNSTNAGQEWLEHAESPVKKFLGETNGRLLFFPYAGVIPSWDSYAQKAQDVFHRWGYRLNSVHDRDNLQKAIKEADGYVVGGGNTWQLVSQLYKNELMNPLREEVRKGKPYIGWSAGSNIACPTLMTTNDMPVVRPPDFSTLGFIPFQINPHYLDANPDGHQGETREQRILEFVSVNKNVYVVGLREGSTLHIENNSVRLIGSNSMRIFHFGEDPYECNPDDDLSFLLASVRKETS